jgi:glycosyltransferase involved in cell wall biosynthesis
VVGHDLAVRLLLWYWGRRGGGAQYTVRLAEALSWRSDVQVSASVSSALDNIDELAATGATLHRHEIHSRSGSLRIALNGAATLRRVIHRERPDAVLHTMAGPLTARTMLGLGLASPGRNFRLVTVIHDGSPHPGDRHLLLDHSVRYAAQRSDGLIMPSTFVRDVVRRRFGGAIPTEVIGLGPLIPEVNDAWDPTGPVVSFGRLLPYKGFDLLANAWANVPAPRPQLRVVGLGPENSPELAQLRNAGAEVRNEWVPDRDLPRVFSGARLVVLPYREASQSGVATLAIAARIPVLATNVGGLPGQLRIGGRIVEPSSEALGLAIRSFLADPGQLADLHHELVALPDHRTVWEATVDQIVEFLEAVKK